MKTNTATRYGSVARLFHWSIAILVLIDICLGVIGKFIPLSGATVDFLQLLYSTHKTIGMTVLILAVLRVIWALSQPRPVPLHPERRAETFAAETAHWLLYAAIFLLPLSGWVMHSAEVGFAPIWWPFAQNLPFIPKSESIAHTAATVHWAAGVVLMLTVAAHIGGALKHTVVDKDATLARMWQGIDAGNAATDHGKKGASAVAALVIFGLAIGGAVTIYATAHDDGATIEFATNDTAGWIVQNGTVSIEITQIGAQVAGQFANWQADIEYDVASGIGQVSAVIDTTTLTLGTVTSEAKGSDFFDTATHTQATFTGDIAQIDGRAHTATGTLTLVGQIVPVTLDFDLDVVGDTATMVGTATLDRRDFDMGAAYPDESSVGFGVTVQIALTAQQQ